MPIPSVAKPDRPPSSLPRQPPPAGELLLNHARYDALQRLVSAETASNAWGLAWSYDGFGNRTNQSVTKGSAPMHSVAIDAATNRIATAGHQYDANGNLTQMPLMTMGYDIANRMTTSNHSGAGTESYGYNHASQRVFVRNGGTVTYYLYGLGGERLMEFQETCTGGACNSYQEKQRWIYFAGRKMFSKTGSTLKAVTPTRLASEAKHFPYGETEGPRPATPKTTSPPTAATPPASITPGTATIPPPWEGSRRRIRMGGVPIREIPRVGIGMRMLREIR